MQIAKINGSDSGWRRKMKMAIIYHCMLGKLNVSGSAFCIYCNEPSIYSNTDKKDLIKLVLKSEEYLPSKKDYLSMTLTISFDEDDMLFIKWD